MTSETASPSRLDLESASLMAMAPRSWAATLARLPLKFPTAVRAAEVMTISLMVMLPYCSPFFGFIGLGRSNQVSQRPLGCSWLFVTESMPQCRPPRKQNCALLDKFSKIGSKSPFRPYRTAEEMLALP
jgi:hypothetical protein